MRIDGALGSVNRLAKHFAISFMEFQYLDDKNCTDENFLATVLLAVLYIFQNFFSNYYFVITFKTIW